MLLHFEKTNRICKDKHTALLYSEGQEQSNDLCNTAKSFNIPFFSPSIGVLYPDRRLGGSHAPRACAPRHNPRNIIVLLRVRLPSDDTFALVPRNPRKHGLTDPGPTDDLADTRSVDCYTKIRVHHGHVSGPG